MSFPANREGTAKIMQRFWLWNGVLGLLAGIAISCGGGDGDGDSGASACVPGQQVACACADGGEGVQQCDVSGGFFGPCTCGAGTGDGADTDVVTDGESATGSGGSGGLCGNGMEDAFECNMDDPSYCPEDCEDDSADGTTGTTDSCADDPIFVVQVPLQPSRWESGALVGFAAGGDLCQQAAAGAGVPDPMEVTVCTYAQVVEAEMAGELAAIPAGTTAWLHRLTVADIAGVPSAPGVGGRCQDWTYSTNHIADGEFAEFSGGPVTYNLDADTFFDGVDTTHTQPGVLECGGIMRSILCCNPVCESAG